MSKLVVANWKMHFSPHEASAFVHRLNTELDPTGVEVVICPPMLDLFPVFKEIEKSKFKLGVQNFYYAEEGAFTGEVSAKMVEGLASYGLVGHSERRLHFHEDDKLIAKKLPAALHHGITPILCVGETLLERQEGHSTKVVVDQLETDLSGFTADEVDRVVVAYEPVWAIGSGNFAKPDEVTPVVAAIHNTVKELFDGKDVRVLYGGSVETDNAKAYLALEGIDGLLVGGASLNYAKFAGIVDAAKS